MCLFFLVPLCQLWTVYAEKNNHHRPCVRFFLLQLLLTHRGAPGARRVWAQAQTSSWEHYASDAVEAAHKQVNAYGISVVLGPDLCSWPTAGKEEPEK